MPDDTTHIKDGLICIGVGGWVGVEGGKGWGDRFSLAISGAPRGV